MSKKPEPKPTITIVDSLEAKLRTLKIESGNPLPPSKSAGGSVYKEFFDKMKVNQNIYITDKVLFQKVYSSAGNYGKKEGKTFAARRVLKDGKEMYGLWRVK